MGLLDAFLSGIDNAKRVAKRNITGLLEDPRGYLEMLDDQAKNYNENVQPMVQGGQLYNRPLTEAEKEQKSIDLALNFGPMGVGTIRGVVGPQHEALRLAQQRAALPVEQHGLGLPANNTPQMRAQALAGLTEADAVQRAHELGTLQFTNIPLSDFKGRLIHKSPSFNRKQSSEYRLGEVDGESAYMRKANHWGNFGTNINEGNAIQFALRDVLPKSDDMFGRVGKLSNKWEIDGPIAEQLQTLRAQWGGSADFSPESAAIFDKMYPLMKKSQAGYVPVSDLVGMVPEKIASFDNLSAPIVSMPDGGIRSRFAAFDPWRRNAAIASLMGVAAPDLLAAENQPMRRKGLIE